MSCEDAILIVHDLVGQAFIDGTELWACSTDASKYFDRISRPHIWTGMGENGFYGRATAALHKIHTYTMNYVKLNAASVTHGFVQKSGVWQGSSPSCLLATIVYEGLFQEMCQMHIATPERPMHPSLRVIQGQLQPKFQNQSGTPKRQLKLVMEHQYMQWHTVMTGFP